MPNLETKDISQSLEVEKNLTQAVNSRHLLFTYPILWLIIALLSNQASLDFTYHGQIFTALVLMSSYRDWHRRRVKNTPIFWWRYQFAFLALLNGMVWAIPTAYLIYQEGMSSESFIWLLATVGIAIGGAVSMLSIKWLALSFSSIIILLLVLSLLLHNSSESINTAICILIIYGFALRILTNFTNQFTTEVSYRLELIKSETSLKELSRRDALTGLYSRGSWNDLFQREWHRAYRYQTSLAVIIINLDNFTQVMDNFGVLASDECIRKIAGIIEQEVPRSLDIVARSNGDEFIVLLTDTDDIGANAVAERIHKSIIKPFNIDQKTPLVQITASLGFSSLVPQELDQSHKLIRLADQSLQLAKETGANRICSIDPELHNSSSQEHIS